MDIRAALAFENGRPLKLDTVQLADPADDEVLVRIVATGVCHTDLTVLDNVPLPWPAIFGHEGSGIVERTGARVSKVVAGDHVVTTFASCGQCLQCKQGRPASCIRFKEANMSGGRRADGSCTHHYHDKPVFAGFLGQSSFATHVLVKADSVVRISKEIPLELAGPLGCGIQTGAGAVLNVLRPRAGSSLAVFGIGAVGFAAIMAARITGCTQIIAVDRSDSRLELARELGATHTVNAVAGDAVAAVQELTAGGANYSVEAAGSAVAMRQAIESLGVGGATVLLGVAHGEVSFDPRLLQQRNLTIGGVLMGGGVPDVFIPELVALHLAGRLPYERLVRFYEFDQINEAISDCHASTVIKPIIRLPAV